MYEIVAVTVGITLVASVYGIVHRLYLSPISHIPGPKLAALTFWYEFYYDAVQPGKYEWRIKAMHERYGPIVRINPEEVHISDSEFYDNVYVAKPGRKIDKWYYSARMFGNPLSMFGTLPHDHHRDRRGVLSHYFSKQSIRKLEPTIYRSVDKVIRNIQKNKDTGTILNLSDTFAGYTGDVIMEYAFGNCLNFLDDPLMQKDWHALWVNLVGATPLNKQFALYGVMIRAMPLWLATKLDERFRLLSFLFDMLRTQVLAIAEGSTKQDRSLDTGSRPSMMHELIHCDLPASEKTMARLIDEGQTVVGAGSITTAEMLSAMMYHLVADPKLMHRLRSELQPVMQRSNGRPSSNELEQLPYLTAVIKEGLRLYFGLSQRLPRIHDAAVPYKETIIPKGTPISMSAFQMHMDPANFPEPESFLPERWLNQSGLDKYLVSFGKGTRHCLGINLAWAEMYLAFAAICAPGRYDYKLFETDISDVKIEHDYGVGFPRLDTKGVRVSVG